eukprot:5703280-Pleurochrysis_carterae.AAC.2
MSLALLILIDYIVSISSLEGSSRLQLFAGVLAQAVLDVLLYQVRRMLGMQALAEAVDKDEYKNEDHLELRVESDRRPLLALVLPLLCRPVKLHLLILCSAGSWLLTQRILLCCYSFDRNIVHASMVVRLWC